MSMMFIITRKNSKQATKMHLSHGFSLSLSNIIQIFVCDRHMGEIVTCDMLRVRLHHTD